MASNATPDEIVRRIVGALVDAGVPYMLTGSLACSFHGAPRSTQDLDFVIAPTMDSLERLLAAFPVDRYYVSRDAAILSLRQSGMFNVIDHASGWKIDFIMRKPREYSRVEFDRRAAVEALGAKIDVATAEDVLIAKLEWAKRSDGEGSGGAARIGRLPGIYRSGARELHPARPITPARPRGDRFMYLALKSLHVLAAVLFLGNIITGVFWKFHGDRTADPRIMAHTLDGIIRSDRLFTIPGVVLVTIFGLAAAIVGGLRIFHTGWIWQSIVLFSISGYAFSAQVAPLQRRLRDAARAGAEGGTFDLAAYRLLSRRWEIWGAVATLTPLAALFLMVLKPGS